MVAFIISRILQAIPVLLAVGFIAFAMFAFVGDPVTIMLGTDYTEASKAALTPYFGSANAARVGGGGPASTMLYQELGRQSLLWAFVDVFWWLSMLCFACVLAVWLFKKVKPGKAPAGAH